MIVIMTMVTSMRAATTIMRRLALLLIILLETATLTRAGYDDGNPDIVEFLDMEDYIEQVNRGSEIWAIQFYTDDPECESCELLHEKYSELSKVVKGIFNIAAVDVTTDHGNKIASHWGIDQLPSIIIVDDNKEKARAKDPEMILEALFLAASQTIEDRFEGEEGIKESLGLNGSGSGDRGKTPGTSSRKPQKVTTAVVNIDASTFDEQVMESKNVIVAAFTRPGCEKSRKLRRSYEGKCDVRLATSVWSTCALKTSVYLCRGRFSFGR
jgi:thiol-disulfide isomerase/thioredoxin